MYEAFDNFMKVETWHTQHPLDVKRFYEAINRVVSEDAFSPDKMGEYMRRKAPLSSADNEFYFDRVIDDYRNRAWAVKDFLKQNGITRHQY